MIQRDIYFFINGVAVISPRPAQELPEPWPLLLDGSWEPIFRKPWVEVFAYFLFSIGEHPSRFELYYPDGHVWRIRWCPDWKCWSQKYGGRLKPLFCLGLSLWQPPIERPART